VQFVAFSADDWRAWRDVRLAALHDAPDAFGSRYDDWVDAPQSRWRDRLSLDALDLVAVEGGAAVGMASGVVGEEPGTVELISMWVHPNARGTGVADGLIEHIAAWASERAEVLELAVVIGNEPAERLYARHGFAPSGEHDGERTLRRPL
jgi:GNAT superfamily N-acetyltransferase